jgi:signal transduction histidine kinase
MTAMNLKQKTLFFVAIMVASLLLLYVLFGNYYLQEQQAQLLDSRVNIVRTMSDEFHEFFSRGVARLDLIAALPGLVYGLQTLEENRTGRQIPAWTTLHYLLYEHDVFPNVFLVDPRGKILWSEPPDVDLLDTTYKGFEQVTNQSSQVADSDVGFGYWKGESEPEILISTPLTDDEGRLVATLIGAIPLSHENVKAILQRNPAGQGVAQLVDGNGRIIAGGAGSTAFSTIDYWNRVSTDTQPSVATIQSGATRSLVATAAIADSPWSVVIDQNAAAALAPVQNLKRVLALFGLIILLLAMSAFFFILRSFTRPVEMLTEAARRIGDGDLSGTFTLDRNDELGVLAGSLDDMKSKLKSSYELLMQSEKMALMGQIVSGLAHELNNPLTIVIGNIQLMQMREHNERNREALGRVKDGAERASRIVKNLLTFARQEKPERKETDVNSIISRTLDLRTYELKVNNIEVSTDFDADLPNTMADPHQLQQVFLNLIINAEQAMIESHGKGLLRIKTRTSEGKILISFADDGPGVAPNYLHRIFEPFFTTKPVGKGTGLGLSICQGIILEHDGKIDVDSTVGRGTTFMLEIPIQRWPIPESAVSSVLARKGVPSRKRILVVEDEAQIRELLVDVLRGQGHWVDTARNGRVALEMIDSRDYDVILTDVKMPELNGPELYASIKRKGTALEQRVIFVTGDVMNAETLKFLESTGRTWLSKPFDIDSITKTVADCLH